MRAELMRKVWFGAALSVVGLAGLAAAEEPSSGGEGLRSAADAELGDVARALRGLDQSYAFRGMQGCGSATAGSVSIDWVARGITPEHRFQPLPPQPLVLSEAKPPCAAELVPAVQPSITVPRTPSPALPTPVQLDVPPLPVAPQADVVHAAPPAGQPCPVCGTTAAPTLVIQQLPIVSTPMSPWPATAAGSIYDAGYSFGHGRTPPNAVSVNGVWMESSSPAAGCGLAPIYYGRPSGRVW